MPFRKVDQLHCSEWAVNMQRDTLSSHIGHEDMLYFVSIAENESVARVRSTMLEVGEQWLCCDGNINIRKCYNLVDLHPFVKSNSKCIWCLVS